MALSGTSLPLWLGNWDQGTKDSCPSPPTFSDPNSDHFFRVLSLCNTTCSEHVNYSRHAGWYGLSEKPSFLKGLRSQVFGICSNLASSAHNCCLRDAGWACPDVWGWSWAGLLRAASVCPPRASSQSLVPLLLLRHTQGPLEDGGGQPRHTSNRRCLISQHHIEREKIAHLENSIYLTHEVSDSRSSYLILLNLQHD